MAVVVVVVAVVVAVAAGGHSQGHLAQQRLLLLLLPECCCLSSFLDVTHDYYTKAAAASLGGRTLSRKVPKNLGVVHFFAPSSPPSQSLQKARQTKNLATKIVRIAIPYYGPTVISRTRACVETTISI